MALRCNNVSYVQEAGGEARPHQCHLDTHCQGGLVSPSMHMCRIIKLMNKERDRTRRRAAHLGMVRWNNALYPQQHLVGSRAAGDTARHLAVQGFYATKLAARFCSWDRSACQRALL